MKPSSPDTKLIKTAGNSGLTRTSQACDRCRIKKIKCDGKIPSCTNCLSIGYNCQTSDKLTRRAFPRGYTENLEKNLISLQNENAKLLTQLDSLKKQHNHLDPKERQQSISDEQTPSISIDDDSHHIKEEPLEFQSLTNFNFSSLTHQQGDDAVDADTPQQTLCGNFFLFDNFIENENYVGLNSLNVMFNKMLTNFNLQPVEELKFPVIDFQSSNSNSITDFIINKFLIKFPSKTNLDLLVSNHFENLNLIPILDEDLFFKNYREVFNSNDNKTENLIPFIKHFQNDSDNAIVFITNLILIIQLNCSIFNLHEIHKLITTLNLSVTPSIIKFQTLLLSLYLFHNKNCYKDTVIKLTNLSHSMVLNLGLHLNYNNLKQLNSSKTQLSKEERFKLHSVRLKLYWSFYILSTISSISFGLPQVGFFEKFHVPNLNSILNSNQNLKNCILLIELLQKLENINLLSINQDSATFKKIDHDLVSWKHDLKLQNLLHQLPSISEESQQKRPIKRLKKSKILSSHEENIKIQLNLFYIYFRILIHLQNCFGHDSGADSKLQSNSVLLKLSKEFLSYIVLLDSRKECNNLNNFEFHLIPINFLKITLISMLNLTNEIHYAGSSNNNLLIKSLKIIKNRYPENFLLFKQIVEFIKNEFKLIDSQSSNTQLNIQEQLIKSSSIKSEHSKSHIDHTSLFFDIDSLTNRNSSITSESTLSTSSADSISNTGNNENAYNETDTSSIIDGHLPEISSSNLDLIFDWNSTMTANPLNSINDSKNPFMKSLDHQNHSIHGLNAYDLNYIVQKNELH